MRRDQGGNVRAGKARSRSKGAKGLVVDAGDGSTTAGDSLGGDGVIDTGKDTLRQERVAAGMFEKESERAVGALLGEYQLEDLPLCVRLLAHDGLVTAELIAGLDEAALLRIGLSESDSQRVVLAGWLIARDLGQYGRPLVRAGIVTVSLPTREPHAASSSSRLVLTRQ